jgi:hypothetical protein
VTCRGLEDWFYLIGYHEERHRRQIVEIRNSLGV